ncbi:MAG: MBL fold metallo-hydrolase [Candidatus Zixiibacteriota bacterium]|nr:MAG: MBL fold metallo-hydrolase [candidate division Zixibacteria bacterium]
MKFSGLDLLSLTFLVPAAANADEVFIYTPVKHATFVVRSGPATIYVDPIGETADFSGFLPPDLILITHIHKAHLDPKLVEVLKQEQTQIIGPATVVAQLGYGSPLGNGETTSAFGLTIEAIAAYNTSAEQLSFHPKGRDNGYLISKAGVRLYVSGDTEDIKEMLTLRDIDIAFLCMNLPYTMTIEQAASAVKTFKPKRVIPYHYRGTAGMSDIASFERLATGSKVSKLKWY